MIEMIDAYDVDAYWRVFCGNARVLRNTRECKATRWKKSEMEADTSQPVDLTSC